MIKIQKMDLELPRHRIQDLRVSMNFTEKVIIKQISRCLMIQIVKTMRNKKRDKNQINIKERKKKIERQLFISQNQEVFLSQKPEL